MIQRRPNSQLTREDAWTPAACAGSQDWLRDPAGMARDWRQHAPGMRPLPAQVLDIRKEDSVDTAPNRFIRFALMQFRDLCRDVVERHATALSLLHEAVELGAALDAALARPFFVTSEAEWAESSFTTANKEDDALAAEWEKVRVRLLHDNRTIQGLEAYTNRTMGAPKYRREAVAGLAGLDWKTLQRKPSLGLKKLRALVEMFAIAAADL